MKKSLALLAGKLFDLLGKKPFKEYDARQYFDTRYAHMPDFADKATLSPDTTDLYSLHHYLRVEANIVESLLCNGIDPTGKVVADIGPGTGHWIDFYLQDVRLGKAFGYEIAPSAVKNLTEKYASFGDRVTIVEQDISKPGIAFAEQVDLVNAIGMVHHIVNDDGWRNFIRNVAGLLKPGGHGFMTDRFGFFTYNDSFVDSTDFDGWKRKKVATGRPTDSKSVLIKRSRSKTMWRTALAENGLTVLEVRPFRRGMVLAGLRSNFNSILFQKKA